MIPKNIICCILALLGATLVWTSAFGKETFIVKDGKPNAEIVIAEKPPRTVRLAAKELQEYIRKISGATLAVTNAPGVDSFVKIYVGKSKYTDKLGIKPYDVKDGGFRMVSGDKWLALIGRDDDFVPIEPFVYSRKDLTSGTLLKKWDKLTGDAKWGNPLGGIYKNKNYFDIAPCAVVSTNELRDKDGAVLLWAFDERGSFNAVCGFLRSLGVRWYMPGELGEVVPEMKSIPLPEVDETVRPDFTLRQFCMRFRTQGRDVSLWSMRLGLRDEYGTMIAHGMSRFTRRKEFGEMHPDYFALRGGKRDNLKDDSKRQLCMSSEGLFKENVDFARAVFDIYNYDVVSIMPPDGFSICQCELCKGKATPERGYRGGVSDYVWGYVNRAAKEVARTHPDKKILCCAYGSYTLPPLKIDKLNPNVLVCIVGGRRPTSNKPEQQEEIRKLRESWLPKTDNKIMIFENYPFTQRGFHLPAYCPHTLGEGINATKGISSGEDIWFSPGRNFDAPGFNHFMVYFTARMYWGGKQQDVDAMFNEYCRLFYGPAGEKMKAFFEYCEANYQEVNNDLEKARRTLDLFAAAEQKVDAGSVYGKRIAVIADYLKHLKNRSRQLAMPRGPVPEQRTGDKAGGIRVDGKLDDPYWRDLSSYGTGRLKELQTGMKPVFNTYFKVAWGKECIYFAVQCEDIANSPLNVGTTNNDDLAILDGDAVVILLETDAHSYYQIAINPAGAVADQDMGAGKQGFRWSSQAEVAVSTNEGSWTIEARIPVVQDENDPLNQVIGRQPTRGLPWFFNVCRQRVRDNGTERSAFSPTGKPGFNEIMKFGKLVGKKRRKVKR